MGMISWAQAWARYATPTEKAIAKVSRSISPDLVADVLARARQAGYVVTMKPGRRGRRR